jgi:hypothetical protein
MTSELVIISESNPSPSDQALSKFAQFLGVPTRFASVPAKSDEIPETLRAAPPGGQCVALSFTTLKGAFNHPSFGKFLEESRWVLVYGFEPVDSASAALRWLSRGDALSIVSVESGRKEYSVSGDPSWRAFPVSGKSYAVDTPGAATAFGGALREAGFDACISVNGLPCAVRGSLGASALFCIAEAHLADIDAVLEPKSSIKNLYAQFVGLAIFLRSAFGSACWTSPVRAATMIIDDPSLKKRYGFVRYETLLAQLQKSRSALSVAFIPYNYRRSDTHTINQVLAARDRFSIAVHGCDHTGGEFASLNESWLTGLSQCARDRMESHSKRTRMPFDNVMVFPQGLFSTKALRVLKKCHYIAAVNSSPWPVDSHECCLKIRDLLDLAVTQHDGVPLFRRRYPHDIFGLAFDALFQKPILGVEHHEYFRSGYESFAGFVREVSAFEANVAWMPLGQTLTTSCVMRQVRKGCYEVRFVTRVFKFMNPTSERSSFRFMKPESATVTAVSFGGKSIPFKISSGVLSCETELGPGQAQELEIIYDPVERVRFSASMKYRTRVFARRLLSDVRDNYLSRNPWVWSATKKAKSLMSRKPHQTSSV